jgi:hypothetical protein
LRGKYEGAFILVNEEAREGMKDATILLGENIRKMVPHSEPSPR